MAAAKKVRKSAAPYYGVAATWILWALLRDLYKPGHFAFVAVLSLGVFLFMRAVCKDEIIEDTPPAAAKEEPSGNTELDEMTAAGQKAISEMKRLDLAIADEKISQDIRRMEAVSQGIFDQVRSDPSKLPQIRQFMDYYLPTTLKLLNAYARMDAAAASGENVTKTKARVEGVLDSIVKAFEKQLDALYGAEALDVTTDITVLETMLAREGFLGDHMEAQTIKNADGTDIKLE